MSTPLTYAPPLPWYRGRLAQRTVIRLLIAAAITFAGVWAFRFVQQLQFLYEQHRWMQYMMPPDKILLAENTPDISLLQKTNGYHQITPWGMKSQFAAFDPPTDISAPPWATKSTVVFLHQRCAPGMQPRLISVVVEIPAQAAPSASTVDTLGWGGAKQMFSYGPSLAAMAQVPADLRLGARPSPCSVFGQSGKFELPEGRLWLYPGQPDPHDESHFTIRYQINWDVKIIDGWLMPDDSVKLEPRN